MPAFHKLMWSKIANLWKKNRQKIGAIFVYALSICQIVTEEMELLFA